MYCSIQDAWDNKNSVANLTKRYKENFSQNMDNELSSYKINNNQIQDSESNKVNFEKRKDARHNKNNTIVYNQKIHAEESDEIQTEDILLQSEEPQTVIAKKVYQKDNNNFDLTGTAPPIIKKNKNIKKNITDYEDDKLAECKKMVSKVLSCPMCRKLIESKLQNNFNPFANLINSQTREIMILILIGLIIMILIDLFIRISK